MKMTREELRQQFMEDSTEYCNYCGAQRTTFSCCKEVHFSTFAQMDAYEQEEFLDWEEENQ